MADEQAVEHAVETTTKRATMQAVANHADGERTVGTKVIPYGKDPIAEQDAAARHVWTADDVAAPAKMQYRGQQGTCLYNLPRSSPEMEAIYGEKRYNHEPVQSKTDVLSAALAKEKDRNDKLETKIDMLLQMMATGGKAISLDDDEPEPELKDMSFQDLRNKAKDLGINTRGLSKEKIIDAITETDG